MTIPIIHWFKQYKVGAMFTQVDDDGREFVVACASRSNNKMEAKYNSYERECIVVVWVVSSFRSYFYCSPFTLFINHWPLNFFIESNHFTRKLDMWAFILQEYDFNILHRANRVNWDATGLNWNPSSNKEDIIEACWHGDVDLKVVWGCHVFAYLCILLRRFGDVFQTKSDSENFRKDIKS
jgi:hypothetical protein